MAKFYRVGMQSRCVERSSDEVESDVVKQTGGPEVLEYTEIEISAPGPGEALVRHQAIGLNFVEIYFRSGVYPAPSMPFTPGNEAAGLVGAVGPDVQEVKPGDRVISSRAGPTTG
jgi:NADPH:quinone reductase-like Zn-dependent oxidoreductase